MRRLGWLKTASFAAGAASLVLLTPLAALAADEVDTPVQWLRRPTTETLLAVMPTAAVKSGKGGSARIRCTVNVLGRLVDCKVVDETPPGVGFGAAALAMAPQLLFKPAQKAGKPVPFPNVVLPLRWPAMEAPTGSRIPGPGPDAPMTVRLLSIQAWDLAPTVADVAAAYPAKAAAAKLAGVVALECGLNRRGELNGCSALREEPFNQGFGAAAKVLARKFKAPVIDTSGKSVAGARVHIPVSFAPNILEGGPPFLTRPKWTVTPTLEELQGIVPEAAAKAGKMKGRVVLACTVVQGGGLDACVVDSEEPAGLGYGEATLRLAKAFKLAPWSTDGLPAVGARIRAPISFDFTDQVAGR